MIHVVFATTNDQRGDLDSVEHLVLDARDRLSWLGHKRVEPAQHELEELVGVQIKEALLVGRVLLDALTPFLYLRHAVHSGASHRKNARDDVEGTEHEGAIDATDDVPHHQLLDEL